jgi:hypothetical protein
MDFQDEEPRGRESTSFKERWAQGNVAAKTSTSSSHLIFVALISSTGFSLYEYPPIHDQDLAETSASSPRNLPIRGVSKSDSQIAQAQDQDEDAAKTLRNHPRREVFNSALQKAQARKSFWNIDTPV